MVADVMTQERASKWRGSALCKCGMVETLEHRWLGCPRRAAQRQRVTQLSAQRLKAMLPQVTVQYGLPTVIPALQAWQAGGAETGSRVALEGPQDGVDGSVLRPKHPEVRAAGWAVAASDGTVISGGVQGKQTIGRAELTAMAKCLEQGWPGTVYGDCQYVVTKCQKLQQGQGVPDGENADLWQRVRARLRSTRGWIFQWIPSHKTEEEAQASGVPRVAWALNAAADRKAKEAAGVASPPQEILRQHWRHMEAEQAMQKIIAKAQVSHLA